MTKKVAQVIADFLVDKGVTDMFTITGGGAMHLNDAFGHKEGLHCVYNHHEQACAIAAEGYARYTGNIAGVCVTSGPGGTNAITGVLGGWQDSVNMFVVSGQVKRETTVRATDVKLRQLGDQEFDITKCVDMMCKYAHMVWEPESIMYHLEKAWYLCNTGRKGPVWLDIPLDVQAAPVDVDKLTEHFDPVKEGYEAAELPNYDESLTPVILDKIKNAKRPLIFAGTGINLANAKPEFVKLVNELKIPVVTAWNTHDLLNADSELDAGRPGTVGNRAGNFAVQTCDFLLVLGSRLNIRLSSYNYKDFAAQAERIIVDIDEKELHKPTVTPTLGVHADVKDFMTSLYKLVCDKKSQGESLTDIVGDNSAWLAHATGLNKKYPACCTNYYEKDYPINHYVFNEKLFKDYLSAGDAVICGNGAACVVTFQSCYVKDDQRIYTNSGCAAMGYGFPAAIGVAVAREHLQQELAAGTMAETDNKAAVEALIEKATEAGFSAVDCEEIITKGAVAYNKTALSAVLRSLDKKPRTICIDGDGSFQMNIQELQTVVRNNLNLKIIIINNNGYHSIRQTQTNLFKGQPYVGISEQSGVSFPDLSKLAPAYGLPYFRVTSISDMDEAMKGFLATEGPALLEAIVDETQNFEPKLSSKVLPDGRIVSPPQDDMFPFLPEEEYKACRDVENL